MAIPKYQQIKNDLLKKIQSGEFEGGDRFYSESELVKMYDVSSITVIRAVQDLANEGYLVRYQGKGTFVSRARKQKLVEFSDIEVFAGETETVEVVSIKKEKETEIQKKLKIDEDTSYYKIIRVRRVNDEPFLLHFSYIPSQFIKEEKIDSNYYDSIYRRFKNDFDIHMYDEASQEVNFICFPTEKKIAEYLEMSTGEPTVRQEKKTILQDGTVAEFIVSHKKWDYYKIEISTFAE